MLIKHEGLKLRPYRDTVGKLTIGTGRNLDDVGITKEEADYLLYNDIYRIEGEIINKLPVYSTLSDNRKIVLMNMGFNLGINGLLKFKKMIAAIENKEWIIAASEMLNSKWARQVKGRAIELAEIMRTDNIENI